MGKRVDDSPFPGLSQHLDNIRLDKAVDERLKDRVIPVPEEPPTNPGVPRSKRGLSTKRCAHGIKPDLCEECSLLLEQGGRYSMLDPKSEEDGGKE